MMKNIIDTKINRKKVEIYYRKNISKRTSFAFTLAEVLITLTIIGVVAAITIPILINSYQKTQYITGMKKFYAEFNQILHKVSADYGCTNDLACTGLFASTTDIQALGEAFVQYFKISHNCDISTNQKCWSPSTNNNYDGTGGVTAFNTYNTRYKFVTADGMSIALMNYNYNNCTNSWSTGKLGYMAQTCGNIIVDVNGLQGPNKFGRDVFQFWITNGRGASIYPAGGMDDNYNATDRWWNGTTPTCQNGSTLAYYCSARIIEEGWEMNY